MPKQKKPAVPKGSASEFLKQLRAYRLHPSDKSRVIEHFYIALDTPVSLSCYLLYKYGEFEQLAYKDIDPGSYESATKFRDDYAAVSFLRKNSFLKTNIDRREVALTAFKKAELQCRVTNQRIQRLLDVGYDADCPVYLLWGLARKIEKILGDFDIDRMLDKCTWGPGVSQLVKGEDTSGARKFDIECEVTRDAYALFEPVFSQAYPLWTAWSKDAKFKPGNHIITVPKSAKTDRTIAIEPGINTFIQLGIGKLIRERLRFAGYNLDSDLKNQRGAYLGSIDDSLATIDFKAASDTISKKVVEFLLPPKWFNVLNAARSHYYTLDGQISCAEKFSTMGNGFTFELESLIFVAAALTVCESLGLDDSGVSVFGDDIIIPSLAVSQYTELVTYLGFTINNEKSFSQGYFRESCGCYYFNGMDVKPLYLKRDLVYAKDLFRLANAIRALSHRFNNFWSCDIRFSRMWSLVTHLIPQSLRLKGPISSGDASIHVNPDELEVRYPKDSWCGRLYTGVPEVPISIEKCSFGLLLARLHKASGDMPHGNNVPLRARTRTVLKKHMLVHQWYDFGPWL